MGKFGQETLDIPGVGSMQIRDYLVEQMNTYLTSKIGKG
jgi:hypothetical protein